MTRESSKNSHRERLSIGKIPPTPGEASEYVKSDVKKIKRKYVVLSEKSGRSFGSYATKTEAEHRLGQIEMFKHMKNTSANKSIHRKK
jgi:hypothetical protein